MKFELFFGPCTMSPLDVRSKVYMAPFHVRSKVCIAPISNILGVYMTYVNTFKNIFF